MPTLMKMVPFFDKTELVAMAIRGLEPEWRYLESYDVNGDEGRGVVVLTDDKAKAIRFPTMREAMEAWRQQSTAVPLRPDGEPNRPLTAYHAAFEVVDT